MAGAKDNKRASALTTGLTYTVIVIAILVRVGPERA